MKKIINEKNIGKMFFPNLPTKEELKEAGEYIDKITSKSIDSLFKLIAETGHYAKNVALLKKSLDAEDKENISKAIKELLDDFSIKKQAILELKSWIKRRNTLPITDEDSAKFLLNKIGFDAKKVQKRRSKRA